MKKALGFLKSNILIFIGALLFLLFLNYLAVGEVTTLVLGIIAVLTALYYIAIGIVGIFIGDKMSTNTRKVFEIVAVCLFALIMFLTSVFDLVSMIARSTRAQNPVVFGPNAWFISVFVLLTTFALLGFYPVARLVKSEGIKKLGVLFAALFALGLLLNVLFNAEGFAINLGAVPFVHLALFAIFIFYLFGTFGEDKEEAKTIPQKPQLKQEKVEEPAPEEVSKEDAE